MTAKNFTTPEERKRRLEGVQHALLVLGDGQEHSARELFERPENATRPESGYTKADLAWQTKALSTLHDLGLIVRTGAHGPTRRYKVAEGADLDPYLSDEGAASLIWETGIHMLRAPSVSELPPPEPSTDDMSAGEDGEDADAPVPSTDPAEVIFSKLLLVLEGFDERLKKIDARVSAEPPSVAPATRDDLGDAAVQILQFLEPRLARLEKQVASAVDAQLSLPAVDMRTITPALEAIGKRVLDIDGAVRELLTEMKKQVNRTQDIATKQLVDKKRFEDFAKNAENLSEACDGLGRYTSKLVRVLTDGIEAAQEAEVESRSRQGAILSPLIDYARSASKKGTGG